jgi:hypothetical protein
MFPQAHVPTELHDKCDYTDAIILTTQFQILYYIFDTTNDLK